MSEVTLRELIQGLIEHGLRQRDATAARAGTGRAPPPVAIAAQEIPVSLTADDVRRQVDEEDLERDARSSLVSLDGDFSHYPGLSWLHLEG